ncbi:chemoreceptor glutamine deamidase CheD [Pleionea sp. CnH1-48]|uniref:chemoreceptor glutamine deamidase CheD n=1 Tax=Pleionea sp. CnH1-48 TaxID=2954494 RepID=UPI002097D768|nr:chemoreceptor glutamine deamidase CheD [Pleionea sp. CnH1-48]MCO7226115.1 chemoreceptor glutamine deamidase CheD [Pleionea sp. CnH1-48]
MFSRSKKNLPPCIEGFENVSRYYDPSNKKVAAKIKPGEWYVTNQEEMIVTVLGSCIAACIRDTVNGVGGMNHFMLPSSSQADSLVSASARYGNFAMEYLINNIITHGGERRYLEVKLFGGANVIKRMSDVGEKNIKFITQYTTSEALKVISEDMGGNLPRKVVYDPLTGVVKVKRLRNMHNDTIVRREDDYMNNISAQESTGSVELFD